ncbi:MAG TPA: flagellar biosynthesis protein FliQ [bacterium]|nr:flagellar biosynthesis protein FliQ [bacterium]
MSVLDAVNIGREVVLLALLMSAPMLGVGLAVGLIISILQAVTQINEMTLTFVPKIILVWITGLLTLPWLIDLLSDYTINLFLRMAAIVR